MAKHAPEPIGYALDDDNIRHPVYNLFAEVDTHGIPLSLVLDTCHEHGAIFGWEAFITSACKAGWNVPKKLPDWKLSVQDVYGKQYADTWEERVLDFLTGPNSPLPTSAAKFTKSTK